MTKDKPILVHKTITYMQSRIVSDEVVELVSQLNKDGYKKIKIIVHEPEQDVYKDGSTHTIYATTVLATLSDNVDIGFNSPQ